MPNTIRIFGTSSNFLNISNIETRGLEKPIMRQSSTAELILNGFQKIVFRSIFLHRKLNIVTVLSPLASAN